MKTPLLISPILFVVILSSCSLGTSSDTEVLTEPQATPEMACEICLLDDQVTEYYLLTTTALALNEPNEVIDSLRNEQDKLRNEFDAKLLEYQNALAESSTDNAFDIAFEKCIAHYNFGSHLEESRKNELFSRVYTEFYMGDPTFSIQSKKNIEERVPKVNEKNQLYTYVYDSNNVEQKLVVEDWDQWKREELARFDVWMQGMDVIIKELTHKTYDELTPTEKMVLKNQASNINAAK